MTNLFQSLLDGLHSCTDRAVGIVWFFVRCLCSRHWSLSQRGAERALTGQAVRGSEPAFVALDESSVVKEREDGSAMHLVLLTLREGGVDFLPGETLRGGEKDALDAAMIGFAQISA